jgi:GNAT superfamily N-acetyltransferase
MPRPEIRPFDIADLDRAAELLAARHAAHRRAEPLLDPRFEDPAAARAEITELIDDGASGAIAFAGGRPEGFLIGLPSPNEVWGPNIWITPAGHAVATPETVRDLYAAAAQRWVDEGRTAHYAVVPATDPALVDAWFRLGFGQQQVHAVRETATAGPPALPPGLVIRRATAADIHALATLDLALPDHQARSPVFSSGPRSTVAEAVTEWEESIDDEDYTTFVAEREGSVVGSAIGCDVRKSKSHISLIRPAHAGFLGFAAVLPAARGTGAGRALGEAVLDWARQAGFPAAVTDWRATNLLSSRAWPRLGFRPHFLRLHRMIGH